MLTPDVDLYDAREKISVFANQMIGKGGERSENYANCVVSYNDIPGMPVIQKQFKKIMDHIARLPSEKNLSFFEVLGASGWMGSLSLVLKMSLKMVESMRNGKSVFVHCSDGWDRTAQTSALCQLVLDPYYRTLEGFMVLVEKEFSQTGHMLRKRLGVFSKDSGNRSPIFLHFLDAVHNVMHQHPLCFQFNQLLLRDLGLMAYFGVFVNFLHDEERIRQSKDVRSIGLHIFDFFNLYKSKYIQQSFDQQKTIRGVRVEQFNLRFWREFFFMYFETRQSFFEVPF